MYGSVPEHVMDSFDPSHSNIPVSKWVSLPVTFIVMSVPDEYDAPSLVLGLCRWLLGRLNLP